MDLIGSSSSIFDELESETRTYCRRFPAVFARAKGCRMWDSDDNEYVDFISGAGALNYGHNPDALVRVVIDYVQGDGLVHGLDFHTEAKAAFLRRFSEVVLKPRGLRYKVQFTGPTGANAVEAALKTARRCTGRSDIVAFTGGFHGLSLGALTASANAYKRGASGVPLTHVTRMPYDGYHAATMDTLGYFVEVLDDPGSGVDLPAAVIVETVQGEGGLACASPQWLQQLERITRERGILLILDEIQTGCGRTGDFFGFEESGITPDLVCLSKSISGVGLPMAIVLIRPEHDQLGPGEHSGTFRGNNLAFVAACAALEQWDDPGFRATLRQTSQAFGEQLAAVALRFTEHGCALRGRGMIRGLSFSDDARADAVSQAAFARGLLVETSGARGHVLKVMPPIDIDIKDLAQGLAILSDAIGSS